MTYYEAYFEVCVFEQIYAQRFIVFLPNVMLSSNSPLNQLGNLRPISLFSSEILGRLLFWLRSFFAFSFSVSINGVVLS